MSTHHLVDDVDPWDLKHTKANILVSNSFAFQIGAQLIQ